VENPSVPGSTQHPRVPQIGYNLLSHIPRLESVAVAVLYQNKNFDGTGFPLDGVSGEEIPIGARILRILQDLVADESAGVSKARALEKLTHFPVRYDPRVVDAPGQQHLTLAGARNSSTTCSNASFRSISFPAGTCQIRQHPRIHAHHLTQGMATAGTPSTMPGFFPGVFLADNPARATNRKSGPGLPSQPTDCRCLEWGHVPGFSMLHCTN
jgi:hypothetical protein